VVFKLVVALRKKMNIRVRKEKGSKVLVRLLIIGNLFFFSLYSMMLIIKKKENLPIAQSKLFIILSDKVFPAVSKSR
jgi:ABC-type uncharacterized transport system permease subunit